MAVQAAYNPDVIYLRGATVLELFSVLTAFVNMVLVGSLWTGR